MFLFTIFEVKQPRIETVFCGVWTCVVCFDGSETFSGPHVVRREESLAEGFQEMGNRTTRWAPTSYTWSYNPFKWPYNWVTG